MITVLEEYDIIIMIIIMILAQQYSHEQPIVHCMVEQYNNIICG